MTSNVGAREIVRDRSVGFMSDDAGVDGKEMRRDVNKELERLFRPEFLNRVDQKIVFNRLGEEEGLKIVDLMAIGEAPRRRAGSGLRCCRAAGAGAARLGTGSSFARRGRLSSAACR